eukprot:gnl/Dysnectes_brevis/3560_a4524_927.p1 GENE.gnl/Dysnectes_brevis/3560_a4524_927~~gnl/Dysnectes_brevis/3560_a4524_927.p1  ORF type:complete len:1182 (+),score=178.84 gnl/Dysnectes_brevis/3560_a4524_927:28-3573(+)
MSFKRILENLLDIERDEIYQEAGHILRIVLSNFLIHEFKMLDFSHKLTLIHGENGSGKSSVAQGIHFALMGKPTKVRQGIQNVQGLIRKVEDRHEFPCYVQLAMSNSGSNRLSQFEGPVIIITRRITATSTGASVHDTELDHGRLRIRGKAIYTRSGDISQMLDTLRQPPSPALLVQQEAMKKLGSADEETRYQMLAEASSLRLQLKLLRKAVAHADGAKVQQQSLKEQIEEAQKVEDERRKRLREAQEVKKAILDVARARMSLSGSHAVVAQSRAGDMQRMHQEKLALLREKRGVREDLRDRIASVDEDRARLEENLTDKRAIQSDMESKEEELSRTVSGLAASLAACSGRLSETISTIARKTDVIARTQQNIARQEQMEEEAHAAASRPLRSPPPAPTVEIGAEEEAALSSVTAALDDLRNKKQELNALRRTANKAAVTAHREVIRKQQEVKQQEHALEHCEEATPLPGQAIRALGSSGRQIQSNLERLNTGRSIPMVGPLAAYIWVRPKCTEFADRARAFITTSWLRHSLRWGPVAANRLRTASSVRRNGILYCGYSGPRERHRLPSRPNCIPILDVVDAEHDRVWNALTVFLRADKCYLCKSSQDALDCASSGFIGVGPSPKGTGMVVCRNRNGMVSSDRVTVERGDCVLYVPRSTATRQKRLQTSRKELYQLQALENEAKNAGARTLEDIALKTAQLRTEEAPLKEQMAAAARALRAIREHRHALQNAHEKEVADVENYNQVIERARRSLEDAGRLKRSSEERIARDTATRDDLQSKIPDLESEVAAAKGLVDAEKVKHDRIQRNVEESIRAVRHAIRALRDHARSDDLNRRLTIVEDELNTLKPELEILAKEMENANRSFEEAKTKYYLFYSRFYTIKIKLERFQTSDTYGNSAEQIPEDEIRTCADIHFEQGTFEAVGTASSKYAQEKERHKALMAHYGDPKELQRLLVDARTKKEDLEHCAAQLQHQLQIIAHSCLLRRSNHEDYRLTMDEVFETKFRENAGQMGFHNSELNVTHPSLPHIPTFLLDLVRMEAHGRGGAEQEEILGLVSQVLSEEETVDNGTISIKVDGRATQTLSGGEGSFSTLCFLVACWDNMAAPVTQIDEWDVFLDADRRQRAFGMLVKVLHSRTMQCVLISPNAVDLDMVSGIGQDVLRSMTKVIHMQQVQRHQKRRR